MECVHWPEWASARKKQVPDDTVDALVGRLRERIRARTPRPEQVLVHEERLPGRQPQYALLRPRLPDALGTALRRRGVEGLYAHQVEAIQAVRDGHDVVITTPTASGKSLAFNLPVLERLLQRPGRRALYLYPTKALMNDQRRSLEALLDELPDPQRPRLGFLSGDLTQAERTPLRRSPPDILLANPDIVHHDLLHRHREWWQLLATLDFLVLDELHEYRGVFGANVALVLRRLLRVAATYGAAPRCIAASATIANPQELAAALMERPFVHVAGDGAGAGPRRFLIWRPPLRGSASANRHASVVGEAIRLFVELVQADRRVILFGPSRAAVEHIFDGAVRALGREWRPRISAYRSGYTVEERTRIESDLRAGRLQGVVTTNALELGIDIGSLDTAVLAGYPGSVMSTWQEAGRVGRRGGQEALIILVVGDDALDQYFATHPARLFAARSEPAVVDPGNARLLVGHLLCAAAEGPLRDADLTMFPDNAPRVLADLQRAGVLPERRLLAPTRALYDRVAIRGVSRDTTYTLLDGNRVVATLEPPYLQREAHPGAVYFHNGRRYAVSHWDNDARAVHLQRLQSDERRTEPVTQVLVTPRGDALANRILPLGDHWLAATLGPVQAAESIASYREFVGAGRPPARITLPAPLDVTTGTIGVWLDLPRELHATYESLHAFEHALVNVLPLHLLSDRRDIGSTSSLHDAGGGRVTLFDRCEGGAGLCERAYQVGLLEALLRSAGQLLSGCACAAGCPSCVHLAGCGQGNERLDKRGGLALLEGRTPSSGTLRPIVPAAAASGGPWAGWDAAELDRRIGQVVADEQRRRVATATRHPSLEAGSRVSTRLGPATVLEVAGDRVRVQYHGVPSWSWLPRNDVNPVG